MYTAIAQPPAEGRKSLYVAAGCFITVAVVTAALCFGLRGPRQQSGQSNALSASAGLEGTTALGQSFGQGSLATSQKKGVGLSERSMGYGISQLDALGVSWFYNWGSSTAVVSPARQFVPMAFGPNSDLPIAKQLFILGFNEPDNSQQSSTTVERALAAWPRVVAAAQNVVGPAMAGDPVAGSWLPTFLGADPKSKVSRIAVHWYKGADAKKFIKDMQAIHQAYNLPLWVTEFAPQTVASAKDNPTKYAQSEVESFIKSALTFLEQTSWVERYAWHDSKVGTSALFDEKGMLTATGQAYAKFAV